MRFIDSHGSVGALLKVQIVSLRVLLKAVAAAENLVHQDLAIDMIRLVIVAYHSRAIGIRAFAEVQSWVFDCQLRRISGPYRCV